MGFEAYLTLGIVLAIFIALVKNIAPPDLLFLGATTFLALFGLINPSEAFAGFSNSGMLTVAALFIVAAGLRETGILDYIGHYVLGGARSVSGVLGRLAGVVLPMSAFLNNTPVVAMFMPVVVDWSRRHRVSPSKLLIPLSYLAILGGTCTLIGTSTNLIINGLIVERGLPEMRLFELSKIGIPYALIGFLYLYFLGMRLLPNRKELIEQLGETRREYLIEMLVKPGCRLSGKTVKAAGLHDLPGLFLIEIDRAGMVIGPVRPDDTILEHDRMIFTGVVADIVDLERIPGLVPAADPTYEISANQQRQRSLSEVVVSERCPFIGQPIKDANFQEIYGAAVVAVHRGGSRVKTRIGDLRLRPGDTLLLQVPPNFHRAFRNDPSFYLISNVEEWRSIRRDRAGVAVLLFVGLIAAMATAIIPLVVAAVLAAVLFVTTGCISPGDARRSLNRQVLITIAASFGVATALEQSGAATAVAELLVQSTRAWGPIAALAVIYFLGSIITELITNNAAAILLFPFCTETARLFEVSPQPFIVALMLAASASFMTPIGYQTNMMVFGPGGYRVGDFLRIGGPLNLLLWIVTVVLVPVLWPF